MSKSTDGQDLTLVGPGTVMGEMMRQYWIPAAASSELTPDCDPMRLMLLGEQRFDFLNDLMNVGGLEEDRVGGGDQLVVVLGTFFAVDNI